MLLWLFISLALGPHSLSLSAYFRIISRCIIIIILRRFNETAVALQQFWIQSLFFVAVVAVLRFWNRNDFTFCFWEIFIFANRKSIRSGVKTHKKQFKIIRALKVWTFSFFSALYGNNWFSFALKRFSYLIATKKSENDYERVLFTSTSVASCPNIFLASQ